MRRLLLVLLLVAAGTVVVRGQVPCDVVSAQPSCYVSLLPGPTEDTLEIVEIDGASVSTSQGKLLLTTVAVDSTLDLFEFVQHAFDDEARTVQRELIYPEGETDADVEQRNAALMANSQLTAAIAGLRAAGYELDDLPDGAEVVEITEGSAVAATDLAVGEVIVAVDGSPVATSDDVVDLVSRRSPGDEVRLTVLDADGEERTVTVVAGEHPDEPGAPFLGVLLQDYLELPVDVTIDAGNVGGPSAGLMFALGIVDLLDPEDLTNGAVVAGTGTIDRSGTVGPIGGIQQKIIGAISGDEPASVFLVPQGNFAEAQAAAVSREILLVPVATIDEALDALGRLQQERQPVGAVAIGP